MTDLRQAAQQALEALETLSKLGNGNSDGNSIGNTIAQEAREHLFTALAQPAQEPVAWFSPSGALYRTRFHAVANGEQLLTPLYTTPPAAQPEQELVAPKCGAIIEVFGKDWRLEYLSLPVGKHKLYTQQYTYTTPPAAQRPWQGLTDEEINAVYEQAEVLVHDSWVGSGTVGLMFPITLYKMFEAKLKERST